MALTPEQVRQVAALAALDLEPEEISRLTTELAAILDYVQELNELDTTAIEPTTHLAVSSLPFRDDVNRPCLSHADAVAAAPRAIDGGFAVPTFVDEP